MKRNSRPVSPQRANRIQFQLGIFFVLIAFLGFVVVVILIFGKLVLRDEELALLQARVMLAEETREDAEKTTAALREALGRDVSVSRVIRAADQIYDDKAKSARDGYLWIDRSSQTWVVTLGALNGLSPGSRLAVFDGAEKIDTVEVDLAMDVIAYVLPTDRLKNQYDTDYFRVAQE